MGGGKWISSIKYLIIAIVFWNLFFIGLSNGSRILYSIFRGADFSLDLHETLKSLIGIFCCWNKDFMPKITPFWFIWVLVVIKVIYNFINQLELKYKVFVGCLCVVYCIFANLTDKMLPFIFDRTIIALPFYICGNIFRMENLMARIFALPKFLKLLFCICGIVSLLLTLESTGSYDMFSMYEYTKGRSILWYYVISLMGTIVLALCCEKLPKNRYVEIISEGTLLILAMHMSFLKILNKVSIFNFDLSQVSVGIIVCVLCIPLITLSKKSFPYALGRRNKK